MQRIVSITDANGSVKEIIRVNRAENSYEEYNESRPAIMSVLHVKKTGDIAKTCSVLDYTDDINNTKIKKILRNELVSDAENTTASTSVTTETRANEVPTPKKKGQKRTLNENMWKKNVAKKLRNCGLAYESSRTNKKIPARLLRAPCKETCIFKCREHIPEEQRRDILHKYWNLGQIEKQWRFIASSIEDVVPKARCVRINSEGKAIEAKRTNNHSFHLVSLGKKIRVCKAFFKSTLAINNRPITTAINKKNKSTNIFEIKDNRGYHGNHPKIDEKLKEEVKKFIDSKRNSTDGSKTIADLHNEYAEICKSKRIAHVNYVMFYRIFTQNSKTSSVTLTPKKRYVRC